MRDPWVVLITLSALVGTIAGVLSNRFVMALVFGAGVPWCGVLITLLINEVFPAPHQGASMWPLAQLFAGSAAAGIGGVFASVAWVVALGARQRHEGEPPIGK